MIKNFPPLRICTFVLQVDFDFSFNGKFFGNFNLNFFHIIKTNRQGKIVNIGKHNYHLSVISIFIHNGTVEIVNHIKLGQN